VKNAVYRHKITQLEQQISELGLLVVHIDIDIAPRSSRFGSEPPSVEDDVDVWRYAIVSCVPETTTTTLTLTWCVLQLKMPVLIFAVLVV